MLVVQRVHCVHFHQNLMVNFIVPSGVLQILTGAGPTTGMDLISDPRIKKVDITVCRPLQDFLNFRYSDRLVRKQVAI